MSVPSRSEASILGVGFIGSMALGVEFPGGTPTIIAKCGLPGSVLPRDRSIPIFQRTSSEGPPALGTGRLPIARGRPAVFGEVLFDEFPDGTRVLGGAPFNVAWHLRGFGADPAFLSAVGFDKAGHDILQRMEEWGLSKDGVQVDRERTTGRVDVAFVDGENRYEIKRGQAWDFIDADLAEEACPDAVRFIYHGTLAMRSEQSRRALERLMGRGAPALVDLNLREPWSTPDNIRTAMEGAHWLKVNEDELAEVMGRNIGSLDECEAAARALADRYDIHRVVVTRGADGSICVTRGGALDIGAEPVVEEIVDTVGAGDAFSAVLGMGILGGWGARTTLDRATRFASEICLIRGATTSDASLYERHLRSWSEHEGPEDGDGRSGLYIMSLSIHGLVRGTDIELGRDPDTGGQVSYVVDEARALAAHPKVGRVDVVTRQVYDKGVDEQYAVPDEPLSLGAHIVRLPFGPRRYLRKESLWPHLDSLLDELIRHVRRTGRIPDLVHGHYADAGYVGSRLAQLLGVPFFFTGHSLGRVKRSRLLAAGKEADKLDERYHFPQRIEAEEQALETASVVIASTNQEVEDQYQLYDNYHPHGMRVIPPGVDLERFSPAGEQWTPPPIAEDLKRFLAEPGKPIVFAIARPDERKNFEGLIEAFGSSAKLRRWANLLLVAGNRDDIGSMPSNSRTVLTRMLLLIDKHDLHGYVAYPKAHGSADVPELYRLAARSGGVFVNPAFTEPFGLTLLEAAASGLPVVATDDGGPRDIIAACENGLLVDATEPREIARGLEAALSDRDRWSAWSKRGVERVHEHFSWSAHAERYLEQLGSVISGGRPSGRHAGAGRMPVLDRIVVTDIDDTLTGDDEGLRVFIERMFDAGPHVGFGIATGRTLDRALEMIEQLGVPVPDVLITGTGTQLHYGERLIRDRSWERQIHHRWEPERVREVLSGIDGLRPDERDRQTPYRIRYWSDPEGGPSAADVRRLLRKSGVPATTILDHETYLDVIPVRASPGMAIRFLCFKWDLPPERLLVAGDSGNDADMLSGDTLGVVVGNHTGELERLRGHHRVYFSERDHAWGVLEGIEHYDFFGKIRPDPEQKS
ncbi:MAG: PfkB family carbohydrate kinase [Gemmatimonadota bacterium]